MKVLSKGFVIILAGFMLVSRTTAGILDFKSLSIDFTDVNDAKAKAVWPEQDKLTVSTNGLGFNGDANSYRDGWIQTVPLAVGLSWRPPYSVSVSVSIHPKITEIVLNNGQKHTPYDGDCYVRYSPDLQHWSTWQALQTCEPQSNADKQNPRRHFSGIVGVPRSEREEYYKMLSEYAKLDVPWKSDEDAAVRWILDKQPDFFARQLPFIGYVQFRYEDGFYGGQRITSFKADASCGIGGIHSAPKDRNAYKDRHLKPWSFKAEQKKEIAE